MKIFILTCFVIASTLAATIPEPEPEPATIYLPADKNAAAAVEEEPATEIIPEESETPEESSAKLGDDGYEYRAVRRLKYRYRTQRDVSHLADTYLPPSNEYIPPAANDEPTVADVRSADEPEQQQPEETAVLADDGYRYKQPEDVAALKINNPEPEYLPPMEESVAESVEPEEAIMPADDGYHYKQPEESAMLEISAPKAEYLPPLEKSAPEAAEPEESAVLADDGYRYRTVRRFRV